MAYCTVANVRSVTGLSTTEISDNDLSVLIDFSVIQINHDIQIKVVRERVLYIDSTRQNDIDGSNTDYYIKNWEGNYLGDLDDDGGVDTNDVIVHLVDSDGTETTATVSAVDDDDCKITLSSAPSSSKDMYITYCYSPIRMGTPSNLLKLACIYLTSAYAFTRIDAKKIQKYTDFRHR